MIPVFTLDKGVSNLFDANGQSVGKGEKYKLYAADENHPEIGKKLYAGEFVNSKLEAAIDAYNNPPAQPAKKPAKTTPKPDAPKETPTTYAAAPKPDAKAKRKAK